MVMRFYWGFGVGHVYSHGEGGGKEILNETSDEEVEDVEETEEVEEVEEIEEIEEIGYDMDTDMTDNGTDGEVDEGDYDPDKDTMLSAQPGEADMDNNSDNSSFEDEGPTTRPFHAADLSLNDRESEPWYDSDSDGLDEEEDYSDDDEFLEMENTYL